MSEGDANNKRERGKIKRERVMCLKYSKSAARERKGGGERGYTYEGREENVGDT